MSILASDMSQIRDKEREGGAGCRGFPGSFNPQLYIRVTIFSRAQRDKTCCEYDKEAWEERNWQIEQSPDYGQVWGADW